MAYIDCTKHNKTRDGHILLMEYQDSIGTDM